jgi:ACS family hexuronate transporter-like MFS transporter
MAGVNVKTPGALKWFICGLLLLATVLNYLDRQVLSLTAEKIISEFHTDKAGFGELIAAFRFSYAAVQFFCGWIVDALGARLVFPLAVGLWSCAGMLTGAAGSLRSMWACRFLLGSGEAFNWPCALKVTETLLEPQDRVLANGIFNSGTAMGAMIAPLIVTVMTLRFGWRSPFFLTGALGFFWIVLWLMFTRGRAGSLGGVPVQMRRAPGILLDIARTREFWLLLFTAVIVNSVSYFLADWVPLYLKTERGFGFGSGNALSMLVYGGLDAGNLLVGVFVRAAVARGRDLGAARNTALAASCILMTSAAGVSFARSAYLALTLLVLTAIGVAGFLVIYLTLVQEINPQQVGAAAGMLGGAGNMAYALLSPLIGRLADLHESGITFVLMGILPWLAFLTMFPVARRSGGMYSR